MSSSPCSRALRSSPRRLLLAVLAFAPLLAPSAASAVVYDVAVTGNVLFFSEPIDFFLNDPPPVDGGESFTLSFQFDDATPLSSGNGTTVSAYDAAVSNISLTLSNGLSITAPAEGVLAAINAGSNHQWSLVLPSGAPGFTTDLPDVLSFFDDQLGEDEDFVLQSLDLTLFDDTETAYPSQPPALVVPSATTFGFQTASVVWQGETSGEFAEIVFSVSSLTATPVVAPAVPALGLPAAGLLLAGLGAIGSAGVRRRGREEVRS